jgi:hypothetical protein
VAGGGAKGAEEGEERDVDTIHGIVEEQHRRASAVGRRFRGGGWMRRGHPEKAAEV